jgi:hypothetical protein
MNRRRRRRRRKRKRRRICDAVLSGRFCQGGFAAYIFLLKECSLKTSLLR